MSPGTAANFGIFGGLTIEDDGARLLCHVCGRWLRNLAQHARLAHGLSADDYRKLAGLNRQTRLLAPAERARLRETTAPLIARLRAEGKLRHWGEDRERWERNKAEAVERLHSGMSPEARQHRHEAMTPERRWRQAERRSARNRVGLDRARPEATAAGLRRVAGTGRCERCGEDYERATPTARYCEGCSMVAQREMWRESARRRRLRKQLGDTAAPKRSAPLARDQSRLVVCARCGQSFQAASHRDKLCQSCRPEAARESQRAYAERRRRARGVPQRNG